MSEIRDSYLIEVHHTYDGDGSGGGENAITPSQNTNVGIRKGKNEKNKMASNIMKGFYFSTTTALGTAKFVGEYTGDYGLYRDLNNAIKLSGIALSMTNPYTAVMTIGSIGLANAQYGIKKRNNDLKAETLRQISGGINNGYRGRKL